MANNVQIAQASIDEKGGARGGQAGNQKGQPKGETNVSNWYKGSGPGWEELIRCTNPTLGQQAAALMVKLVNSNLVGYDQGERNTLWFALQKNGWNVDRYIQSGEKTETDCSAFVYTCYCVVLPSLRAHVENVKPGHHANCPACQNLWSVFNKYGSGLFLRYTDASITRTTDHLIVGDMLNRPTKHVVMVVSTNGSIKPITVEPDYSTSNNYASSGGSSYSDNEQINIPGVSNNVKKLAAATKRNDNILKQDDQRKEQFESLANAMATNAPMMGRDILLTSELYNANILKGSQESRKERV